MRTPICCDSTASLIVIINFAPTRILSYDTCKELTHELLSYEYIFRGEGNGSVLLSRG